MATTGARAAGVVRDMGLGQRAGINEKEGRADRPSGLDLDQGDGLAIGGDQVTGLAHQGGSARGAREGDHQHRDLGWGGHFQSTAQQQAIPQWPSGPAIAAPFGRDHLHRPGEGAGGLLDQAIGTAGAAMEQERNGPAGAGLVQGGGNSIGRPIEGTAATGHDHQGS